MTDEDFYIYLIWHLYNHYTLSGTGLRAVLDVYVFNRKFREKLDFQYKILILGDATVGKTSILLRYIDDKFDADSLSTLGVDVRYKYVSINNKKIRMDIWDTAGEERFKNIAKNYFKNSCLM